MSLFGGAPDYSHLIWRPSPQSKESVIDSAMAGLGAGMQHGRDYKKAKKQYIEQSWVDPTGPRPEKPNPFSFYFGTAPEQQSQFESLDSKIDFGSIHETIDKLFQK